MAVTPKWTLQINVAGIPFFEPGGAFDRLPTGCYEAVIEKAEKVANKTAGKQDNIQFDLKVAKGEQAGKVVRRWLSTDTSDREGITVKEWKNLLATVAKDPAALEKGNVTIPDTLFVGKTAYIFYKAPAPGEKDEKGRLPLPDINFVTKEYVAKQVAVSASTGAGASNGAAGMEVKGGAPQQAAEVPLE